MIPLKLPPNQQHRFYRGGEAIARFRGIPDDDEFAPEAALATPTSAARAPRALRLVRSIERSRR